MLWGTGPLLSRSGLEQAGTHSWPGLKVFHFAAVSAIVCPETLAKHFPFSCHHFSMETVILLSAMPHSEISKWKVVYKKWVYFIAELKEIFRLFVCSKFYGCCSLYTRLLLLCCRRKCPVLLPCRKYTGSFCLLGRDERVGNTLWAQPYKFLDTSEEIC